MNTKSEKQNILMKRKEVVVQSDHTENPGEAQCLQDLVKHFKTTEDCVVINRLGSSFGSPTFTIEACIYESTADKEKIEPTKKVKKGAGK